MCYSYKIFLASRDQVKAHGAILAFSSLIFLDWESNLMLSSLSYDIAFILSIILSIILTWFSPLTYSILTSLSFVQNKKSFHTRYLICVWSIHLTEKYWKCPYASPNVSFAYGKPKKKKKKYLKHLIHPIVCQLCGIISPIIKEIWNVWHIPNILIVDNASTQEKRASSSDISKIVRSISQCIIDTETSKIFLTHAKVYPSTYIVSAQHIWMCSIYA